MMSMMRNSGSKTFTAADQEQFARLSHDCNPLHMDPVAARRLIAGAPVVHGMHILLVALENWHHDARSWLKSISCGFKSPVCVGDTVDFVQEDESLGSTEVRISVKGQTRAHVSLKYENMIESRSSAAPDERDRRSSVQDVLTLDLHPVPMDEAPEWFEGKSFGLSPELAGRPECFPIATRHLGREGLASTLLLSYFVGMVCPGMHSIFSSVSLHLRGARSDRSSLLLTVLKFDPRFQLFDIRFSGPIEGRIRAFRRPAVQQQPSIPELKRYVNSTEFEGTRSLVIGGSRGLGEVTAKLLAAGGGDTVITYSTGIDDANAIVQQINLSTSANCRALHLDLNVESFDSVSLDWQVFDAVYYFATPRIFRPQAELFDATLFGEFLEFYVIRFHELCERIERERTTGRVKVYFPSTVSVDVRPKGMTEYAMAKAAGEILAQEMNRRFVRVEVHSTRLPRLSTDQTASIARIETPSNAAVLLPLIRAIQLRTR